MKPEAPVTSALAADMIPQGFPVSLNLLGGDLRGFFGVRGIVAIPTCRQLDGAGKRQGRYPSQLRSRFRAVEMQQARLRKAPRHIADFRPGPDRRELFDQIADG